MKAVFSLLLTLLCLFTCCALAETPADDGVMREGLTAVELTRLMGNGTNLGNTFEACDNKRGRFSRDPRTYEAYWGQPVTTPAMLEGMKAAGFDTIRIPVAWMTNATDLHAGDYTIDESYLARVRQVVDDARRAGMYVILNDHWDGGWWGMFGSESEETRAMAMEAYTGMWRQIAEYFSGYSDYLIFESANEELGARFDEDSPLYCKDSLTRTLPDYQRYALCNKINQAFVDTVRASGGNNASRFLLIAGYGTNIDATCDMRFVMPRDSAADKLLLSVHYYDPWSYCGAEKASGATKWGIRSDFEYMDRQLKKLQKFTRQGVGVVIGEYGALPDSDGNMKANDLAYHTRFLDLCTALDMTSCLWDTSGFFDRRTLQMTDDEMADLYLSRSAESEEGVPYDKLQAEAAGRLAASLAEAPLTYRDDALTPDGKSTAAWLMWASQGWALSYSVGDDYSPDALSPGIRVTDAHITGEGTYTVGLDFTGTAQGCSAGLEFTAIGIAQGEKLFPGYVIDVTEVRINGELYAMHGRPCTSSDNGVTTRANLFNPWVPAKPSGYFRIRGNRTEASSVPLNREDAAFRRVESITVTFTYGPAQDN